MPEIIGQNPKHEVECKNCGTQMTFRLDEVEAGDRLPHNEDFEHSSVITCPKCKRKVDVTSKVGPATDAQVKRDRELDDYL